MTHPTVGEIMVKRERADVQYEVVQTSRAFEEVMAQLRRLTVQGQLKPGDRLPAERDLAQKLGVSRNTIREALRGLEMAGVLELRKGAHGGAFLIAPSGGTLTTALQDMFQFGTVTAAQLTEARLYITAAVGRVACERIREEDLMKLEQNVADAREAERNGQLELRSRINLDFHRLLARATGNPIFVSVMDGLLAIMEHFIETLGPPQIPAVFDSRMRVIAALRARDGEAAAAGMEAHLRVVHEGYLSRMESTHAATGAATALDDVGDSPMLQASPAEPDLQAAAKKSVAQKPASQKRAAKKPVAQKTVARKAGAKAPARPAALR